MKKRVLKFISIMIITIFVVFIVFIFFKTFQIFKSIDYKQAKKESIKFLSANINNLQEISDNMLLNKSNESKKYKNVSYSYYKNSNNKEYIQFDIDAQGMLGGQYWGIIYCPNDDLLNYNFIEIYDENKETGEGNNIFIKEKLKDKWYFYYDDYDGNVDIKSIN